MFARIAVTLALALAAPAGAIAAPAQDDAVVERVVLLMRHGVRPSTKFPATPKGTTREPWAAWTTAAGDLTPHGADAVRRRGAWDRTLFVADGLLPADGCAKPGTITAWASGASRAIKTGRAYLETLTPGCPVPLDHPASEDDDALFHPATPIDGDTALAAARRLLPTGGLAAETARNAAAFATLERVTGCCPGKACDTAATPAPRCGPAERTSTLIATPGDKPDLKGAIGFGSTAGQTILLQYLEGMPMAQVGWGRASKADIATMLRFHPLKFRYETRAPYVAERIAAPLARRVLDAIAGKGGAITLLFGHDTNLAALGGFYGLHWTMADYPADDIAPGGALGFEVTRDRAGRRFVRAFTQSQTMDQVRDLAILTPTTGPRRAYIAIPGCGEQCPLGTFARITTTKLAHPAPR